MTVRVGKNMRPLVWFTAAMLLFLTLGITVSISRQRAWLLEQEKAHMDHEFSLLQAVVSDNLLKRDYAGIRDYLMVSGRQSQEIISIRAVASDGRVLAEYHRPDPTARPLKRGYCIPWPGRGCLTLELTYDLDPGHRELESLTRQQLLASVIFAVSMALCLWYVLRRKAFIPLERAMAELNDVNAGLERRVAERTAEWTRANAELKNEIAEREAAQRELMIKDRAIATSINGITLADFSGAITYVNASCLRMWGYDDAAEVLGRPVTGFWRSGEEAAEVLNAVQASGIWSGELTARRRDGSFFSVHVSADVVRDAAGSPICLMAAVVDITERKRSEEELRKEKNFTAAVLDTIGSIVLVLDSDGRIVRFNRACEEASGYAFEEVRGKFVWEFLIPGNEVEPVKNVFGMLSSGSFPVSHENYWIARDGTRRMIAWSNTCLTDAAGAVSYVIATGIDVTENRRTVEELAKSEAKHRLVVENIGEIIYRVSISGGRPADRVEFVGGRVTDILGCDPQAFVSDPLLWQRLVHPDDLPAANDAGRRVVRDRAETTRLYRLRHRSGDYVWLEDKMVPQVDASGSVVGYFGVARDITRRKQTEDALKDALIRAEEEKNKSDAIIAAIGDGISIQDRDFRVLYQNAYHRQLVGSHVGEFCYRAYQRRDEVCPGCPVALAVADGKVHIAQRENTATGRPLHVEIAASPLRDASGAIIAGIEVVRNITDRKQAEENVRRAYETQSVINALLRIPLGERPLEEVLREALEIILSSSWYVSESKGGILLADGEGGGLVLAVQKGFVPEIIERCTRVPAGKCLCGRAAAERGIQFAQTVDERHEIRFDGMQPHGHYCVPILASEKTLGVLSLYLRDGHPFDAYEQEFLLAVANALAGIIERKRMEEERERMILDLQKLLDTVSASRLEWQETFDSITDMISIHDHEYRIVKANKAFAARFGLEPRDVINRKCYELFHGGSGPVPDCPHGKTLACSGPVTEELTDPATGRVYLISTFPFFSSESSAARVVHISRDITEAKENEMRLIMSERLAALGQMASGIAHEINNPLAAIAGCVDGMNRRIGRGQFDRELFTKYLAIIKEELTRTKNITTSMLSVVRKKEYEKKRVDIHNALLKALEIIGYQGRLKNVQVEKKIDGPGAVFGSEGELKQVFVIMITNALDAMDDAGTLSVETSVADDLLTVAISDTGPGIPPGNLGRIFDPFFTTKSERGGTGLGLSIANRIIAGHGGVIRVSAPAGTGATFLVQLPLPPQPSDPA